MNSEYKEDGLRQMTKEQIAVYNYWYCKDPKEAEKYLTLITPSLRRKQAEVDYEKIEDHNVLKFFYEVDAGVESIGTGIENWFGWNDDLDGIPMQTAGASVETQGTGKTNGSETEYVKLDSVDQENISENQKIYGSGEKEWAFPGVEELDISATGSEINYGKSSGSLAYQGSTDTKIKPSGNYDIDAKPSGTVTKISLKADETTTRSLLREKESAEILARNGYNIEQNPKVPGTREPDYIIEGEIFDCYSPEPNTKVRGIWSNIYDKVIKKQQTERIVINLNDWIGNIDDIVKNLNIYPIDNLKEVIVIKGDSVISIYP